MPAPLATYRVQLRPGFGFREVAGLAPYLAGLGISHVYCSPVLQAKAGSAHGYDVIDHSRISDELGGETGWRRMVDALRQHGLGVVVDVVPNHMAADPANRQWADLLAHGPDSAYAEWFDVDWAAQDGRVLLPVLPGPAAETAEGFVNPYPSPGAYRLAWWRLGGEELNYRRFFDVSDLAAVRVEDPAVFDATHARLLRLVELGDVDGFRIDHPDGLADPGGYLDLLAKRSGGVWVVVEKILQPGEALPAGWACAGTTGYDALRRLGGVFVDPAGERPLTAFYAQLTGEPADFARVEAAAKRDVIGAVLGAELNRLTAVAYRAARAEGQDLSQRGLREALEELLAGFEVYRDYGPPWTQLDRAVDQARAAKPGRAAELAFLDRLAREPGEFCVRLQQTCGPVMAKGVEDTAFYRWFRFAALNEVGGAPARLGVTVADFHRDNAAMQQQWPASMTTLSTHDTKRSEDVRARLAVLSELPGEWRDAVVRWRSRRSFRADANLEYLFWQTLVGAWPLSLDRALGYLEKASREAKRHTSWTDPDPAYDEARDAFVRSVFDAPRLPDEVAGFVARIAPAARCNMLGQKLLQLAMPGVPDVYNGTELVDLSLVDPDNRRPIDYAPRKALLAGLGSRPQSLDEEKLLVVARTLALRRAMPAAFAGDYQPVYAEGPAAEHLVGFARGGAVVALATRLPVGLAARGGWAASTVRLPGGRWRDELTGAEHGAQVRLAEALDRSPVALLTRAG